MGKTKDVRAPVEAELGFDPLVNAADIKVVNLGGDVTLAGTVPSYPQYLEAAAAARRVAGVSGLTGVRNVRNDIDISYVIDPVDVDLHVQQALDRSAMVPDGSDVRSGTKDGVITLTGHVSTWAEHDAMVGAAWMALGSSTLSTSSRSLADRRSSGLSR
jgi:osmotically-inducible protein OsmY